MPNLPNYDSQQNIRPQAVAPLRDEASQPFQDQQKILGTMQEITQKWSDANDVMQYTEAKAKHGMAVMDIESRAAADPDFKNSDKYFKELAKARQEATQGIKNQQVASKASIEFDYDTQVAQMKIAGDFRKKQLEYNKIMVKQNMDTLLQGKLSAATPAEAQQYDARIDQLLADNINAGALTIEEADVLASSAEIESIENLVYSDPEYALKKLKEDNGLSPKNKQKMIDEANQLIKKREELADWQLKQNQTQSTIDLSDALYNKTLNPKMVRDMQQQGLIDAETAAIFDSISLNKKYEIAEGTSKGEPDYFIRLLEDSMGDKAQIQQIMSDAAKAYANHKIGSNQYLYFIQSAKETFDRQRRGIFTPSKQQSAVRSALKGISDFGKNFSASTKELTQKFFDRFKPDEDPQVIKNEVLEEALNDQIENSKTVIKKMPVRMISPDGRIFEVQDGNVDKALKNGFRYAK